MPAVECTSFILAQTSPHPIFWIFFVIIGLVILAMFAVGITYFNLWFQAKLCGVDVRFGELIGMRFRKVHPSTIVISRIRAAKYGLDLKTAQAEAHYLAGGDVPRVVKAMVAAKRAEKQLDWETAFAIDLSGRDVLEAVETSSKPDGSASDV